MTIKLKMKYFSYTYPKNAFKGKDKKKCLKGKLFEYIRYLTRKSVHNESYPSTKHLAKRFGRSERQVYRYLKEFKQERKIECVKITKKIGFVKVGEKFKPIFKSNRFISLAEKSEKIAAWKRNEAKAMLLKEQQEKALITAVNVARRDLKDPAIVQAAQKDLEAFKKANKDVVDVLMKDPDTQKDLIVKLHVSLPQSKSDKIKELEEIRQIRPLSKDECITLGKEVLKNMQNVPSDVSLTPRHFPFTCIDGVLNLNKILELDGLYKDFDTHNITKWRYELSGDPQYDAYFYSRESVMRKLEDFFTKARIHFQERYNVDVGSWQEIYMREVKRHKEYWENEPSILTNW